MGEYRLVKKRRTSEAQHLGYSTELTYDGKEVDSVPMPLVSIMEDISKFLSRHRGIASLELKIRGEFVK